MQGMSQPQRQALGRMLGLDEGTVNLLSKGRGEIDKLLEEMRRLGTVSDEDAKVGQDLINSFKGVGDALKDVGRAILTDVSPYLTSVLNGMKEWIVQNKEWLKAEISAKIKEFGDWLKSIDWKAIRKDIDDFLDKTNEVVKALGGWKTILEAIFGPVGRREVRRHDPWHQDAAGRDRAAGRGVPRHQDGDRCIQLGREDGGRSDEWSPNSPFWRDMSKEGSSNIRTRRQSREANPRAGRRTDVCPGAHSGLDQAPAWLWPVVLHRRLVDVEREEDSARRAIGRRVRRTLRRAEPRQLGTRPLPVHQLDRGGDYRRDRRERQRPGEPGQTRLVPHGANLQPRDRPRS